MPNPYDEAIKRAITNHEDLEHKPTRSKIPFWKRVYRCVLHIPVGLFNAWLIGVCAPAGVLFAVRFIIYEVNQDWRLSDHAYADLMGDMVGFAAYFIIQALIQR